MNFHFLYACECGASDCTERIKLSLSQYKAMSARGLVLVPAHAPRRVVERTERFAIAPAGRLL